MSSKINRRVVQYKLIAGAVFLVTLSGCQQAPPVKLKPIDPSSQIHEVPIFPGPHLLPLNYRALSGGKVTRYHREGDVNPNDPVQEAALEACQELPINNAVARSASVVFTTSAVGDVPVSALVVGNTVFISLHQTLRAIQVASMNPSLEAEILYPFAQGSRTLNSPGTITLTFGSHYATVWNKKIPLKAPVYLSKRHDVVITLSDFMTVFHEHDLQVHGPSTIQSAVVSYEQNASLLYHPIH